MPLERQRYLSAGCLRLDMGLDDLASGMEKAEGEGEAPQDANSAAYEGFADSVQSVGLHLLALS